MGYDLKVFTGNTNRPLAEEICATLDTRLADALITRFPGGETHIQIDENVRGCDVFVVQPICANEEEGVSPNDALMELLILCDAARRASARRITAVVPYYGYARQDRKDRPRVPITAKLVANMIYTAGARRVLALDLHANQIQGFFDIPVDHLYSINILGEYFKQKNLQNLVVVSPDVGGIKMARAYAELLGAPLAIVDKRRWSGQKNRSHERHWRSQRQKRGYCRRPHLHRGLTDRSGIGTQRQRRSGHLGHHCPPRTCRPGHRPR